MDLQSNMLMGMIKCELITLAIKTALRLWRHLIYKLIEELIENY